MDHLYDFARHLRTVHFTLVVACVGLLVASVIAEKSDIDQALEDLRGIRRVQQRVMSATVDGSVVDWMRSLVRAEWLEGKGENYEAPNPRSATYFPQQSSEVRDDFDDNFYSFGALLGFDLPHPVVVPAPENVGALPLDLALFSLEDFIALWDSADRSIEFLLVTDTSDQSYFAQPSQVWRRPSNRGIRVDGFMERYEIPTSDGSRVILASSSPSSQVFRYDVRPILNSMSDRLALASVVLDSSDLDEANMRGIQFHNADDFNIHLISSSVGNLERLAGEFRESEYFGEVVFRGPPRGRWSQYSIILGIVGAPARLNPVQILRDYSGLDWGVGKFREVFGDLYDRAGEIDHLSLEDIQRILAEERNRSRDHIEIAGIRLPGESILNFGVLLIVGIQGYFAAHLRVFASSLFAASDVWKFAWMGVYGSSLAKIQLFLSAIVLPISTATILMFVSDSWAGWTDVPRWEEVVALGGFLLSVILGALIMSEFESIWARRRAMEHLTGRTV